jgi:hypothetical protein
VGPSGLVPYIEIAFLLDFLVDQRDPYSYAGGIHFNELLKRYGAPVIVLNLVKVGNVNPFHAEFRKFNPF